MLARCRTTKLPKLSKETGRDALEAHIRAYDEMLLGMPARMNMKGDYVRPHLIRKHMLAAAATVDVVFRRLTMAGLRSMTPDMCKALLEVPSWLPPKKLSGQLQCKVEYLAMWACLWKDALELDGAAWAVFNDTESIKGVLEQYLREHNYPPSPYVLMRKYLKVAEIDEA